MRPHSQLILSGHFEDNGGDGLEEVGYALLCKTEWQVQQ